MYDWDGVIGSRSGSGHTWNAAGTSEINRRFRMRAETRASIERTVAHASQHENDVAYVTKNREQIMEQRTMSKWEKILKVAVNAKAADQTSVEGELLQLGILAAHWRELEVQTKLERGEWVIINVNAGTEHHFVLLKPKSKMMSRRNGHIVCPGEKNGLCAFTAALHIAKAGGALDASDPSVGKLARRGVREHQAHNINNERQAICDVTADSSTTRADSRTHVQERESCEEEGRTTRAKAQAKER